MAVQEFGFKEELRGHLASVMPQIGDKERRWLGEVVDGNLDTIMRSKEPKEIVMQLSTLPYMEYTLTHRGAL